MLTQSFGIFKVATIALIALAFAAGASAQGTRPVPPALNYVGSEVVYVLEEPNTSYGAGRIVDFDVDNNGSFERSATVDANGVFTIAIPSIDFTSGGAYNVRTRSASGLMVTATFGCTAGQLSNADLSSAVPVNLAAGGAEPNICTCRADATTTADASSTLAFSASKTPIAYDVELATGKMRQDIDIMAFATRDNGFGLSLQHASLVDYNGPYGKGWSHSFNLMIVRTGSLTAKIITANLRVFDITSVDGITWTLPAGWFSTLTRDDATHRWTLTHFSGLVISVYESITNHPGLPVSISEPNGNTTALRYDFSGYLTTISTDLGQVETFAYNAGQRLQTFTDHLGRVWTFGYNASGHLSTVTAPSTEYANIASGVVVTDTTLPSVLVTQTRVTNFYYLDSNFPNHLTAIQDPRSAIPSTWAYDITGRVQSILVNGNSVLFNYAPTSSPTPVAVLDSGNLRTRVTDREGNVTDFEIHSATSGPVSGAGKFGLRRTINWTETGKGNLPLRTGEPNYWEQRWLLECDCLSPTKATQAFRSDDVLVFDPQGMPTVYPMETFTYNDRKQITDYLYSGFGETIRWTRTYDTFANFSRMLTYVEPRGFDTNPIYLGLSFTHTYTYTLSGNLATHTAPVVTRGVPAPQTIVDSWTYNLYGQVLTFTDPNGNITTTDYFSGSSVGGTINTQGMFGGYRSSITVGAVGSTDPATNLVTNFRVNSLGMVTLRIDPMGKQYTTEYNDLEEVTRELEPPVTLHNGSVVQYENRCVYDGAGNKVLDRRINIDANGVLQSNAFIDQSTAFNDVNNVTLTRAEIDGADANDLIAQYAYDRNDQRSVDAQPEGNRAFQIYDERGMLFKVFYGVSPGLSPTSSYPTDKRATTLVGASFVGFMTSKYDARRNMVQERDGRGGLTDHFFDFSNRRIATSDQNGNGVVQQFDDGSGVLTRAAGVVSKITGLITTTLERTYFRRDELGRQYQITRDITLATNEGSLVDPTAVVNSSDNVEHDKGGRTVKSKDANSNATTHGHDSANRLLLSTDPLLNQIVRQYDANGNLIQVCEIEVPGPGCTCPTEMFCSTLDYDELNRLIATHERGLNGTSIDHINRYRFDSRGNEVMTEDEEHTFTLTVFDDFNRQVSVQTFDGDPALPTTGKLTRQDTVYDRNSRVIDQIAYQTLTDDPPPILEHTQTVYDDLNRPVRCVTAESDDPLVAPGNGADGIFDRIEYGYDPNSNPTFMKDQREVIFTRTFDAGNRLIQEDLTLPAGVCGETRRVFIYDALNRRTEARNNYARVVFVFDTLSRLLTETEYVRLDGSGFINGWERGVQVSGTFDKKGNRTDHYSNAVPSLSSAQEFSWHAKIDQLDRVYVINSSYFATGDHNIAVYAYCGKYRVDTLTLGNGAKLTRTFDVKRRLISQDWRDVNNVRLVGVDYGYDDKDNPLHEIFAHDGNKADNFGYNRRFEVSGVNYRSATASDYRTFIGPYGSGFSFDANLNRTTAAFSDPFGASPVIDQYTTNRENEHTQINRNTVNTNPITDRAGNMLGLPVRPAIGPSAGADVGTTVCFDAYNHVFQILVQAAGNTEQHYRYDALDRRIVVMELSGPIDTSTTAITAGRRFIWDGWETVQERVFLSTATLGSALNRLERVYVNNQMELDARLLCAIDGNGNGNLTNSLNIAGVPGIANTNDYHFYYLGNDLNTVFGILQAADSRKMLEYYRYEVHGEATIMPIVDTGVAPGSVANDGIEDTPLDLTDNYNQMLADRVLLGPAIGRASRFKNQSMYTGRYLDEPTGLVYFRARHYEPRSARFISRDPVKDPWNNLYGHTDNAPTAASDPTGLKKKSWWSKFKKRLKKVTRSVSNWIHSHIGAIIGGKKMTLDYVTVSDVLNDDGGFHWTIDWVIAGAPRKKKDRKHHWIVQQIGMTDSIADCAGNPIASPWGRPAHYIEAWKVKFVGFVPIVQQDLPRDRWDQDPAPPDVRGIVTQTGRAIWMKDNTPEGWSKTQVPQAGGLHAIPIAPISNFFNRFETAKIRSNVRNRSKSWQIDTCP